MKTVIIGNGKVGSTLAAMMSKEDSDVTVIDINAAALEKTQNTEDVMCIVGNGIDKDIQKDASVNKSDLVIATTNYDEVNLLCCLIAKKLGADKTIARVRSPEYYKQIDFIREDLGLSLVINPEAITADEIVRVLITPEAANVEVFEKGRMELVEYKIPPESLISDCSLKEIYKRTKIKFLICAVQRDEDIYIPGGDFILREGDRISIAAPHKEIEQFFKMSGSIKDKVKSCIIIGGGRICYYLTKALLGMGMKVKIIEKDLDKCKQFAEIFPKASIIQGDGTDQDLLVEEGIRDADAFVALTGIDEENIIMSMYAKNNSDAKVVTKINRESYVSLAGQIGLDCLVSPKNLSTNSVIAYVRSLDNTESNIESIYHIVNNRIEAAEFKIREAIPGLTGLALKEIKTKKNMLICSVVRNRQVIIPDGSTKIELNDSVVVVSKEHRFSDIKEILE